MQSEWSNQAAGGRAGRTSKGVGGHSDRQRKEETHAK